PNTVQAAHAIDDALHVEGVVILGRASEWHDMRHQQDAIPGGGYLLDELRDLVQQHAAVLTLGPIASYQWAQVQADHTRGVGWPELLDVDRLRGQAERRVRHLHYVSQTQLLGQVAVSHALPGANKRHTRQMLRHEALELRNGRERAHRGPPQRDRLSGAHGICVLSHEQGGEQVVEGVVVTANREDGVCGGHVLLHASVQREWPSQSLDHRQWQVLNMPPVLVVG